ncbi:glycosyltransferase family 39 protein [Terrabacter sp. 2RAF25]|uniref:glycosyltransferase family 39 protein n=1 Tax=Terrabacter sp. 2RAF25 TaxID=3232998 RepID=UPI003F983FE2
MRTAVTARSTKMGILASRVTGATLLGLVLLTIVVPRFTAIPYDRLGAIGSFVGLLVLALVVGRRGVTLSDALARRLALPVAAGCTAVAAFVGYASYYVTTWDSKLIQNVVTQPRDAITPAQVAYLSRYPNNDVLLALARQARRLGDALGIGYGTAFLLIQVVFFAIALLGVYRLTVLLADRVAGLLAMVLLTALVGLSPWMAVPYTDIPSMWTTVWAVYCFVRSHRSGRPAAAVGWAAGGGVTLALGYALKVTPVAVLVAGALWFVALAVAGSVRGSRRRSGLQLVGIVLGLVSAQLVSGPVVTTLAEPPRTTPGVAASSWHYVASGLRTQVGPNGNLVFGGYDRPVNSATFGRPTDVQTKISQRFIRDDLQRRGVGGVLLFEVNKLDFTWGDGMFWAYGEGTDLSRRPVHDGRPFELVQSWNSPDGQLLGARVALTQGLWWLVLTLVGVGWLRGRVTAESLLLLASLVGVAAFTLLFQGRSRYLITYLPLVVVAATWWWRDLWSERGGLVGPRGRAAGSRSAEHPPRG